MVTSNFLLINISFLLVPFCAQIHSVLEMSLSGLEPFLLTDVVWSMCVLQQAKPHYLILLAQQTHITKLSGKTHSCESLPLFLCIFIVYKRADTQYEYILLYTSLSALKETLSVKHLLP